MQTQDFQFGVTAQEPEISYTPQPDEEETAPVDFLPADETSAFSEESNKSDMLFWWEVVLFS